MPLPASKKLEILHKVLKEGKTVSGVCRQAGIARKTFYKWKKRYQQASNRNKKQALELGYRSGKRHPRNKRHKFENKVISIVIHHPSWGSRKIAANLGKVRHRISNHAVYELLKDLSLETKEKRQGFISLYQTFAKIRRVYRLASLRFTPETRRRIIEEVVIGDRSVAEVCRQYRLSRKAFYKWLKRYKEAEARGENLLLAMKDNYPRAEVHPRGTSQKIVDKILAIVVAHPEYSTHKIGQMLAEIGNHGVQNVLQRFNLNTYENRLTFAETYVPKPVFRPVAAFWQRVKLIWERFILTLLPVPPPSLGRVRSYLRHAPLGILFFSGFSFLSYKWLLMIVRASPALRDGLFLASIALVCGTFFFLYSLRYYLTTALVLSFSREEGEEGLREGREGKGMKRAGLLEGIFGLTNGNGRNGRNGRFGFNGGRFDGINGGNGVVGLNGDLDKVTLERYPFVSIHLPLYNEKKVAKRILEACTKIDYSTPGGQAQFEIIVCDDSTDETVQIVQKYARKHNSKLSKQGKKGPFIEVLHRPNREGFKGGALAYAVKQMDPRTEFVVVFDADFVPYPDTLLQFLKHFKASNQGSEDYQKSKIAVVGGYQWHVLNKSENWITRGVRTEYAGSYVIERPGQELTGALKQISGSVYMIRADVLKEIGWGTSITEDFQLTLKLYEKGYKVVYTPYVQAPAECVSTLKRLIRQRMRWAEGHSQNIKKMFFRLMKSPNLNLMEKLEVLYLSPYYLQAAFFLVGTFSWLLAETVFKARLPFWTALWGWSLVLTNLFALPLMNSVGLFLEEAEERDYLGILSFVILSYIVVPFQAYASIKGFLEHEEGTWFRTPKTGKITDILTRGRFYRWITRILPWRISMAPRMMGVRLAPVPLYPKPYTLNPYFALATANNRFINFRIPRRQIRLMGRISLVILLLFSTTISSLAPSVPYFVKPTQAQASFGIIKGAPSATLVSTQDKDLGQASSPKDSAEGANKTAEASSQNSWVQNLFARLGLTRGIGGPTIEMEEVADEPSLANFQPNESPTIEMGISNCEKIKVTDPEGNEFSGVLVEKVTAEPEGIACRVTVPTEAFAPGLWQVDARGTKEEALDYQEFIWGELPPSTSLLTPTPTVLPGSPKPSQSIGKHFRSDESLVFTIGQGKSQIKKTKVYDAGGREVSFPSETSSINASKSSVLLKQGLAFKPGRYRIEVLGKDDEILESQDFTWGVLAINVPKSIYLPSEKVEFGMTVLNDRGHTVCTADVELKLIEPGGGDILYSTANGSIQRSTECGPSNVTYIPDFKAEHYLSGQIGTYRVLMKAVTSDGTREIEDSFEVRSSVDFDVERYGPVRIYPPSVYEMKIKVKTNVDFKGEVVETVPGDFEIISTSEVSESFTSEVSGETKVITWEVDWKAGETHDLSYQFDAPDISPYFYLLGPLRLVSTRSGQASPAPGPTATPTGSPTAALTPTPTTTPGMARALGVEAPTPTAVPTPIPTVFYQPTPEVLGAKAPFEVEESLFTRILKTIGNALKAVMRWAYDLWSGRFILILIKRLVTLLGVRVVQAKDEVFVEARQWQIASDSPGTITHFVKTDSTERSRTSSSAVEETNYTVNWSNLTGAGLAAGDDVIIMVFTALRSNNISGYGRFQVGFGTTYAGRTDEANSYTSVESAGTTANNVHSYFWMGRRTLVVNENIYFSLWSSSTYTGSSDEFRVVVFKLADLQSTDFLYAETTPSGNAPTDYATGAGASANTGASGDWLFFGGTRWLDDSATAGYRAGMVIDVDGVNYSEIQHEGEDTENSWNIGTITYRAGLASGRTARVRYRVTNASTHDCVFTNIFGLRLDAFKDHWGTHTTNTITHSVVDTYQAFATKSDYSASQTGNVLALGLPIHTFTEGTKTPYGRILLDGGEWPSSAFNRAGYRDNGAAAMTGPWVFGYASINIGTRNFVFQCAEDTDISPTYNSTEQIAVIFSMELPPSPTLNQNHYRWRNDSYGLNTNDGWQATEDNLYDGIAKQTTARLRAEIANTGGASASNYQYRLEYAARTGSTCGDESYTAVPVTATTEHFEMVDSGQYTDGDNTTTGFLTGVGTRADGEGVEDPSNQTVSYSLTNGYYTEFEYAIQATTNATDGQTYCFRLTNAGSTSNFSYTIYPQLAIRGVEGSLGKSEDGWGGAIPVYMVLHGISKDDYPYARAKVDTPATETYYTSMSWDAGDSRYEGTIYIGSWYCNGCVDPTTGSYTVTVQLDNNAGFPSVDYSRNAGTFSTFITRRWPAISTASMGNSTEFNPTWNTDHWDYQIHDFSIGGTAAAKSNVAFAIPFHPTTASITNMTVTFGGVSVSQGSAESTTDAWWWDSATHTLYVQENSLSSGAYTTVALDFDSDTDLFATRFDRMQTYNMSQRLFYNGLIFGNNYMATPMYGGGHEGAGEQVEAHARDFNNDNDVNIDCMERVAVHVDNNTNCDTSGYYNCNIKWKQDQWADFITCEDNNKICTVVDSDGGSGGWEQQLDTGIAAKRTQIFYANKRYIKNTYRLTNNSGSTRVYPIVWGREQWIGTDRATNDQGRFDGDTSDRIMESTVAISGLTDPWMTSYDTGVYAAMGVVFEDDDRARYGYFLSAAAITNTAAEWVDYGTEWRVDDNDTGANAADTFFDKNYPSVVAGDTVTFTFWQWGYDTTSWANIESAIGTDSAEVNRLESLSCWSSQRKTFYDSTDNAYWQFSYDEAEIDIQYNSAPWSISWSADSSLAYETNDFSVWEDGTYVYLAYYDDYDIKVRRGTLNASSISWEANSYVALNGASSTPYQYAHITKDSSGYLWVSARYYSGTNYYLRAAKCGTQNDPNCTWTAYDLSDTSNTDKNVYGVISPLGSQDMYAAWIRGTTIEGKKWTNGSSSWDGSATSIGTGKSGLANNLSMSSDDSNNLHLAWIDSNNYVQYKKYSGSWDGSPTRLDSNATNEHVTVSVDTGPANDDIYVVYIRDETTYYKKYTGLTSLWGSETDPTWTEGFNPKCLTSNYSDAGRIFAEWTPDDSPCELYWNYVIIPERIWLVLGLGLVMPGWLRRRKRRKGIGYRV